MIADFWQTLGIGYAAGFATPFLILLGVNLANK